METDLGHWSYKGPEINIDNMIGFIYCITCGMANKKYIGKKLLQNKKKRKPLKGRVNSRRYKVASDWKTYTGSSPSLNEYIAKNGKEGFGFEILSFQPSKLLLSYHEVKEIIEKNAIFSNEYYNEVCCLRIRNRKKQ